MPDHSTSPVGRLAPEVRNYAVEDQGRERFVLAEDLDRLHRVHQSGAPEAAVFYCARILEVLAEQSLRAVQASLKTVRLSVSELVFRNLNKLEEYNLLQAPTRSWAHALRRLGNVARHVQRRVQAQDVEVSVLFVERCLEWYFRRFRTLDRLTRDGKPFALTTGEDLRPLLVKIGEGDLASLGAGGWGDAFLRTAALPAAVAEMMLDRRQDEEARDLLAAALSKTPDDLRLNQLMGLYDSRNGRPELALRRLEPLYARFDDGETAGITAGAYKRLWLRDKTNKRWLDKSHRAYRRGWDGSQTDAYLGINAATTALWLGQESDAGQIAAGVRQLLQDRIAALREFQGDKPGPVLNYWDHVTLAEAQLLLRDFDTARLTYREAFQTHAKQAGNIKVSREQLEEILRVLGPPYTADEFLAGPGGGAA